MKIVNKLSGFIVLVAMIGSTCMPLVSCEQPVNVPVNKPGVTDPGGVIMNISEVSEWDWFFAAKDGSIMLLDVNETTGMPTRLYLKPADEAVENGITFMLWFASSRKVASKRRWQLSTIQWPRTARAASSPLLGDDPTTSCTFRSCVCRGYSPNCA